MHLSQFTNKTLRFCALCAAFVLCLAFTVSNVAVADMIDIKVQGLMKGKALVSVDGQQYFFKVGQTIGRITLVSASNKGALLRVNGKEQFHQLYATSLDSVYTDEFLKQDKDLTPNEQSVFTENVRVQARSHIISVKLLREEESELIFELEYFYNGEYGENARLKVDAMFNGQPIAGVAHHYSSVRKGRDYAKLHLFMTPSAPQKAPMDALLFELQGTQPVNGKYSVNRKYYPHTKIWQKKSTLKKKVLKKHVSRH